MRVELESAVQSGADGSPCNLGTLELHATRWSHHSPFA